MPTVTILSSQVLDSTGRSSGDRQWPPALHSFQLTLIDSQFTSGEVELKTEFSWDNGATWPYSDTNRWAAGAKDRFGNPPSVAIGPFVKTVDGAVVENNPTHGRATIRAFSGSPRCGVSLTT